MMKVYFLLKWLIVIFVCTGHGILSGSYITFWLDQQYDFDNWLRVHQVATITLVFLFLLLSFIISRYCQSRNRDSKGYFRGSLIAVCTVVLAFALLDEKPQDFGYNWDNAMVPIESADESYGLIAKNFYAPDQVINVDLSSDEMRDVASDVLQHEEFILDKWDSMKDAREIIEQLDAFDGIADLSMPDEAIDIYFLEFEHIARVYRLYALLMVEKGDGIAAIRELNKIHSVARKALPYARYLIHKLIWIAIAERNIQAAFSIAANSDRELLAEIKRGFPPLSELEASFKNALVTEFFFIANETDDFSIDIREELYNFCSSPESSKGEKELFDRYYLNVTMPFIFRTIMTRNAVVRLFDLLVRGAGQDPPLFDKRELAQFEKIRYKNSMGWFVPGFSMRGFEKYAERAAEAKAFSDLFHIYLCKRAGVTVDLDDYLNAGGYIETSEPFVYKSTGYDGIDNTEDDVYLTSSKK